MESTKKEVDQATIVAKNHATTLPLAKLVLERD